MIPGITTDYGATQLSCDKAGLTGIENFVGGVSNGEIGISVMRYTNPLTKSLYWQKVWFFLKNDVQFTMISNITSTSGAPVISVLDQRRRDGAVFVDDGAELLATSQSILDSTSLWHGDVGYVFPELSDGDILHFNVGERTGNWTAIGISTQPPVTVDLFTAWIEHSPLTKSMSYIMLPGVNFNEFLAKRVQLALQCVSNDGSISAIYDETHKTAMAVFWQQDGGSVTITPSEFAALTISSSGNTAIIYHFDDAAIFVSDPSQSLAAAEITLSLGPGEKPPHWGPRQYRSFIIELPSSGLAGSSVHIQL